MEFKDAVKQIGNSEKKVDKVLKAARLERHERTPMSDKRLEMVLSYIAGYLAMILAFAFFFMFFYFSR